MGFVALPKLIPVVELEPGAMADLPSPAYPCSDDEFADYWRRCLAAAGLGHLAPIRPGSWHVPVASFVTPDELQILLSLFQNRFDDLPEEELPLPFNGGCALVDGETVIFEPQCCGDLGNLEEWRKAATYHDPEPRMLWIGHPWLEYRFGDDSLWIRREPNRHAPTPEEFRVAPQALTKAVREAAAIQHDFGERLTPLVAERGIARSGAVARALAGEVSASVG